MLLKVTNLTKEFAGASGTIRALDDVSLSVDAGQLLAVRGPSGCGKTTLLLTVGGLLQPNGGTVHLDGHDPYRLPPDGRAGFRARNVGFVFQQFHLVPYLSVLENVLAPALAGAADGLPERAWELVRYLHLEDRAHHLPAKLSTGERQRTAVARAMLRSPRLLLADEPTGNLDGDSAQAVLTCLAEFAKRGGAVILATHDDRAACYASKEARMDAGRISWR